jgi:hypothetical protein
MAHQYYLRVRKPKANTTKRVRSPHTPPSPSPRTPASPSPRTPATPSLSSPTRRVRSPHTPATPANNKHVKWPNTNNSTRKIYSTRNISSINNALFSKRKRFLGRGTHRIPLIPKKKKWYEIF